jgi:hypothetical protein
MNNASQKRQGDVFFQQISEIPDNCEPVKRTDRGLVLAEGEATGHAHAVLEADCELFEENGTLYLKVGESGAVVQHEEHGQLTFAPNTIQKVTRKRVWTDNEEQLVRD